MLELTINGQQCGAEEDASIISVATASGIYIPTICHHPDLPPFCDLPLAPRIFHGRTAHQNQPPEADAPPPKNNPQSAIRNPQSAIHNPQSQGCGLCVVEIEGRPEPIRACCTPVAAGLAIQTESESLKELRRASLMQILARHPHACLTCAQREGCSLEDCSSNVPKDERCCSQFHNCELRRVVEHVGIAEQTPRYRPAGLPVLDDEPLFRRDFNLCIDCARCVRACNQLRGVDALGLVHEDGHLLVGSVRPTLIDSGCRFCGACVEVCPTGCLTDQETRPGDRESWLVPCMGSCPAGVDVPGYIRRIAVGDFPAAAALVWEKLPLANLLGHICFHECEGQCRRGDLDEPIAICALKRLALQAGGNAFLRDLPSVPSSGRKAAVVGAGPAGLAAAYFLRFKGHAVTVFEAAPYPGGQPARSIPEYRLPPEVLQKDISVIRDLGVEIKTGCNLATGQAMADLLEDGFDALLVAVGLPHSKKIPLEGSHLPGVFWGLDFLSDVKAGKKLDLGRRIVVVGGGNVAIDVAMTALRLAHQTTKDAPPDQVKGPPPTVRLYCLESSAEMPAHRHEIEKARSEGIEINPGWGPAAVIGHGGKTAAVEFRSCQAVFDEQRRFAPRFNEEQRTRIEADAVILAVGQAPPEELPLEREGIFLAGDVTGPSAGGGSAVHAVASGRAAAERIDRFLGGDGNVSVELCDHPPPDPRIGREEGFAPRPRVPPPCADPRQRSTDFRQIDGTYRTPDAVAEARRCLQCDLRLLLAEPPRPPEKWLTLDRPNVEQVPPVAGVFILAGPEKKPTAIKGLEDLRAGLLEKLDDSVEATFFLWEEDRLYTKRESELIQQHLEQYGELPGGGDDELDDLF